MKFVRFGQIPTSHFCLEHTGQYPSIECSRVFISYLASETKHKRSVLFDSNVLNCKLCYRKFTGFEEQSSGHMACGLR